MTRICVDTNALLRYLTNDLPIQAKDIKKRLQQAKRGLIELNIFQINIVEILYQLENWYKFPKDQAAKKISNLLKPTWFQVENKSSTLQALGIYAEVNIDFVDLLTWTKAQENDLQILSFDRDFDKLSPKIRLEP